MNVSKLTLSWRWLSSASFSVASSSIPSSSAFSRDTELSNITQMGSIASSTAKTPLRLGCRSRSMVQDALLTVLCLYAMALLEGALSWADWENNPVFADRRVQPFKGTLRGANEGKGDAPRTALPLWRRPNLTATELVLSSYWVIVQGFWWMCSSVVCPPSNRKFALTVFGHQKSGMKIGSKYSLYTVWPDEGLRGGMCHVGPHLEEGPRRAFLWPLRL